MEAKQESLLFPCLFTHEQRWLRQKFSGYADYEQQVRRFIPWIY